MLDEVQRGVAPSRMETLAPARTQVYSNPVGSQTFDGVRFAAYSDDHPPPHVHAFYAEVEVVMELIVANKKIRLARRKNCIIPASAKRSHINRIIRVAKAHSREIHKLWEAAQ